MSTERSIYNKFDVVSEMLAEGRVELVIDSTHPGVDIPESQRDASHLLVLAYGYDMPVAIPDLELSAEGISATLSFNRVPQATFIPWTAVVGAMQRGLLQVIWEAVTPVAQEPKKPKLSLV